MELKLDMENNEYGKIVNIVNGLELRLEEVDGFHYLGNPEDVNCGIEQKVTGLVCQTTQAVCGHKVCIFN